MSMSGLEVQVCRKGRESDTRSGPVPVGVLPPEEIHGVSLFF